jgi:hypothetical protein
MKRLLIGAIAALAIGLTGCTVAGQPTAARVQPSDFAIDIVIVDANWCGDYFPQLPLDSCAYSYNVSARWLPAVPLPGGTVTVVYTVTGGEQPMSNHIKFSGMPSEARTSTNPLMESVIVIGDPRQLTGRATYVTVD